MRTLIILIGLIAGTAHAQTEQRLPTDNELRASYCITFLQNTITVGQQFTKSTDKTIAATAAAALAVSQNNLRKLQLYLIPRVPYLNATALMGASASAQEDVNRADKMTPEEQAVILKKVESCRDLSWLPI